MNTKDKMVKVGQILTLAIQEVFESSGQPVFVLAVQLPETPLAYEYISTAARTNGIKLLRETADSMERRLN